MASLFTINHTTTDGPIYSGRSTVEITGYRSVASAIASAEARCLDYGGSYYITEAPFVPFVALELAA